MSDNKSTWNAIEYPAIFGWTVTERHTKVCAEKGHAMHIVDGNVMDMCPRCGTITGKRDRYEAMPSDAKWSIWDNATGTWADISLGFPEIQIFGTKDLADRVARLMNAAAVIR